MNKLLAARSRPLTYAITDRRQLPGADQQAALTSFIAKLAESGVDLIQLRERDLPARMLLELARTAAEAVRSSGSLILINDRSDVAAIARVGVHLTTRSMDPCVTRRLMHGGASFAGQKDVAKSNDQALIGASTHLLDEVVAAEDLGADFVVFGPIFETSSKREYGPPVGVKALEQVTKRVSIPVLGLGGIDSTNFGQVLDAGAAGVAGISMFATATDLPGLVAQIKAASKQAD